MHLLKNTIFLLFFTFLCTSCSKDDDPITSDVNAEVLGTYSLTALNVSPAQDINEDGTTSTNLLDEMNCITGTLILNADTSWNLNIVPVNVTSITGDLFFIACGVDANTSKGTWTLSNGQLSLNGGSEPNVYLLSSDTLTKQISKDLSDFQSTVFTKQ